MATDPHPKSHGLSDQGLAGEPGPTTVPTPRRIDRLALAMLFSGSATLVIAWLAFLVSRAGVAPVVLFPIALGVAIGGAQTAILRQLELSLPCFGAAALALAWGGLAVATEDYSGYRDYVGKYVEVQHGDGLAPMVQAASDQWQPAGFAGYLSAIVRRDPIWWTVDVALTLLAAAVVAGLMSRRGKAALARPPGPPQPASNAPSV